MGYTQPHLGVPMARAVTVLICFLVAGVASQTAGTSRSGDPAGAGGVAARASEKASSADAVESLAAADALRVGSDASTFRSQPVWHDWFAVDGRETPYVGDFDGDERTDIITFTRDNPLAVGDVFVALSTGTRFGENKKWHDWFAIDQSETVVIGDYNGDGRDDIATWLGSTTRQVYVATSFGTGMSHENVWLDGIGQHSTDVLFSGDADGDGKKDLIAFARTEGKVYVARSTGTSFRPPEVWHNFFAVSTYERPRVADVDGDGKTDIVTFATNSPAAFGDVYVALSNGQRFGDAHNSVKWHDWFGIDPNEEVRVGDADNDGKEDFFTFLPPARGGDCYQVLTDGTRLLPNVLWPAKVRIDDRDKVFVGDVDGDGKANIIIIAQGEGKVYVSLAEVDSRGVPRFVRTDYIDLSRIGMITRFRSGIGHDYSDDFESCRTMKHYYLPSGGNPGVSHTPPWSEIPIHSPVSGTIAKSYEEWAGSQVWIRSREFPTIYIIIPHVGLASPLGVGDTVREGQLLGRHIGDQTMSDIMVGMGTPREANIPLSWRLLSYFDVMTDALLQTYKARGVVSREAMQITRSERDADPLTCVGEEYANGGHLENWVILSLADRATDAPFGRAPLGIGHLRPEQLQ